MAYYVKNEELECSTCGEAVEPGDANICPVCNKVFCKDCSDANGELWCDEDNEELVDFENFIELDEEDEAEE